MTELPPTILIFAAPRSFSSVIAAMLGQHPEAYGLPELNLFSGDTVGELFDFFASYGERKQRRQDGLVRAIAEVFIGQQDERSAFLAKRWLQKNQDKTTAFVFTKLRERIAPQVAVEKSISTVWNARRLRRALDVDPTARFIHLTRHPRGHGESVSRLDEQRNWNIARGVTDYRNGEAVLDPQLLWYRINERIDRVLAELPPERWLRVRGEDILGDPDQHLPRLADWLGLRTDGAAIDAMKHPERSPFAGRGPDNAPFGLDPEFVKRPELRPGRAREHSLEGALRWRADGAGFRPKVKELATAFGYH